jgi:hypothetical protein
MRATHPPEFADRVADEQDGEDAEHDLRDHVCVVAEHREAEVTV